VTRQPEPPLTRRDRRNLERRDRPLRERPRTARPTRRRRPIWQSPFVLVSAAALAVALAVILLNVKPAPSTGASLILPPTTWSSSATDGETAGSPNAPVTMDLYADFQCPVCGRFVRDQLGALKTEFIDTGTLRIVAKDIAFLGKGAANESLEIATGARCAAAQNLYWPFHDLIYWNQQGENVGAYTSEFIRSVAARAGVDLSKWDTCVGGDADRAIVQRDTATALGQGINSTPTIVLNGGAPAVGLPDAAALAGEIRTLAAGVQPPATLIPASTAP
jgi:protein-disulfide isomerase